MCIDLDCGKAFMAEHLFYSSEVGSTVQQMRRKCMPEHMGTLLNDLRHLSDISVHQYIYPLGVHFVAPHSKKEGAIVGTPALLIDKRTSDVHERRNCIRRFSAQ